MLTDWQARMVREVSERVGKRYATLFQMRQDEMQAHAWMEGHNAGRSDPYCLDPNPYLEVGK
jgi:hypothetical protein